MLLDGRGGVLTDQTVVIRGSEIVAVQASTGTTTYDLSAFTVMPGGIDTHVHLSWHFDDGNRIHTASGDADAESAHAALHTAENAYRTLLGGITTVQSLGSPVEGPVAKAIEHGLPGPRVITSLAPLGSRSGTPDELRVVVRERQAQGARVIKLFASESIRDGGGPTMTQEQLVAACDEARGLGLRIAVHAHGPESARRTVNARCTVIEHGALLDRETLLQMAQAGTYYDPHIGLIFRNYFENKAKFLGVGNYTEEGFAAMERAVPKALAVFRQALQTPNLAIVFGTDAVAGSHGRNFEELIYRVQEGGQDPMDAIVSATSRAARSLGLHNEIGSIAPGMAADIIALDGNPLEDVTALRRVAFVMRGGNVYKN